MDGSTSHLFSDPSAPTVSLDSLTNDGEYTPVQRDQLDLASMVDCAYSMADWSTNRTSSYASPVRSSGPTPSMAATLEPADSTAADLAVLDSMYTALSSLGFQQDHAIGALKQVDSSVGSVHASPGVHSSPVSTDPAHSPLQCHVAPEYSDDISGIPRSPHAVPVRGGGQPEGVNSQSMAAARSALIEMQKQGLSYHSIEELVQNIQNLLNCLREKQNVGNVVNKVRMDERLRQVVLQMLQSGNPQAAQEASMLFAAAAAGIPYSSLPQHPAEVPQGTPSKAQFPPTTPFSPMGPAPHPFTPDASPISTMQPGMHDGPRHSHPGPSAPSGPNLAAPRRSHPAAHDDPMLYRAYNTPSMSSTQSRGLNTPSYPPDLSPPPTPQVPYTPSLTPRAARDPRPIRTPQTPRTPRVAGGHTPRRLGMPTPQTPTTPQEGDALSDLLSNKPSFKVTSLQSMYDCKAASEPLPGAAGQTAANASRGTGVFIPGLHKQPVDMMSSSATPGMSAPLSGRSGGKGGAPLSAPLSEVQCPLAGPGMFDTDQVSPDSLSASAELARGRSGAVEGTRPDKPDRGERGPNPIAPGPLPMHAPMDPAYSGSLSIMDPPAYSGSFDPPAYSGSFFTQELPDEEESRDLSGSGPFRHMTCHTYAGGEVMRTLFSNDAATARNAAAADAAGDSRDFPAHRKLHGVRQGGCSAPIMECPPVTDPEDPKSISATLSPHSGSIDNFHSATASPPPHSRPADSLADALASLSLPGDPTAPTHITPGPAMMSPNPLYRRTISDRGPRGGSSATAAAAAAVSAARAAGGGAAVHQQASGRSAVAAQCPPAHVLLPPGRLDARCLPAGECIPLNVTQWSQDHSSVTIFLQLERFNPASLMVQIQQHMVVVMALNSEGPSHVFMMRPEHAVRVQGSKSKPQPGNGIQIVLQKRSPGTLWSSFGTVATPQS